jgi:uncharacterized protein (TIGR02246 family)
MTYLRWGVLITAVLVSQAATAQQAAVPTDSGAAELAATIDQYAADYNAGDLDRVMSHWAENADFVDIRSRFHEGRDLISALFRRGFADNPGRTIRFESVSRKFLAPDVAVDDGILELTAADGEKNRGRYTVVWTKVDGKWLIRSARDIPLAEEEATEEPQTAPLEELNWLVGKWQAKSEKYDITLDCDWQLDKNFLVQTFHVKSNEDDFRVVTYIGFDPDEARFRSWFFDSRGGFGGGVWTRRDSLFKAAIVSVLPDGQVGSSVMTWEQKDDNTLTWQSVEREVNGESLPDAMQTYIRVK